MLNNQTINDLHKAFEGAPGGFLVVDSGRPSFAVLPYQIYQKLKSKATAKKNIKRILVTGGAGYIGSTTVKILLDRGYEVVVFDNLSTGRAEAVSCKLIVGDLADREALEAMNASTLVQDLWNYCEKTAARVQNRRGDGHGFYSRNDEWQPVGRW